MSDLADKARFYERASTAEAWVMRLQTREVELRQKLDDKADQVRVLKGHLKRAERRTQRLERVLKKAMPYLFNGVDSGMEELWREASDALKGGSRELQ